MWDFKANGRFLRVIETSLLILVLIVSIIIIVPIGLVILPTLYLLVWILSRIFRPDLLGFVNNLNALFTIGESANFPLNILGIAFVNGVIDIQTGRRHFEERVFSLKKPNGQLVYHRLQETWTTFLGYPFWTQEKNFDLAEHTHYCSDEGVHLPPAPTEADLQAVIGKILVKPWKKGKSPWEVLLIPNYKGESKTVQLIRIDHVLADGLSIYELYKIITQGEWKIPHFKMSEQKPLWYRSVVPFLHLPYNLYSLLANYVQLSKVSLPNSKAEREIIFSVSPKIHVDVIKQIKNHYQVSYGAVCYAAICGAIARAFEKSEMKVPRNFLTSIVLPRPNHPGGLCIHAGITLMFLPLRCTSPEKRLRIVQNAFERASNSSAPYIFTGFGKLATAVPPSIITTVAGWSLTKRFNKLFVSFSNMPVTCGPDYYEGMEVSEMVFAISLTFDVGLMISLGGLNNKQLVSFCVHNHLFKSEDIARSMGVYFAEEIQELVKTII